MTLTRAGGAQSPPALTPSWVPLAADSSVHAAPAGWRWHLLTDLARLESGHTPSRYHPEWWGGDIPWLALPDIRNLDGQTALETTEYTNEDGLANSSARLLPAGTVCLSRTASVGFVTVLGRPMATSQDFVNWVCGPQLDPWFLAYLLLRSRGYIRSLSSGAVHKTVYVPAVKTFQICVPPLTEQKRISLHLHQCLSAAHQALRASGEEISAADSLLPRILEQVFSPRVGRAGSNVRLSQLLRLRKEVVHPRDNPIGEAVFVGLEHIETGTGRRLGELRLEMASLTGRKPRFYQGDVVYGYLRPYLNKVWLSDFDGLCSVDQYVYEVDDSKVRAEYVAWFMRSPVYLRRAPISYTPGQLPRIRTEEVAAVEMPLPDLARQDEVLQRLNEQISAVGRMRSSLADKLTSLTHLPNALLRHAFAGDR